MITGYCPPNLSELDEAGICSSLGRRGVHRVQVSGQLPL
jgi:hypothetical protein